MTTTIQAGPTGVPSDVLAALDRMCTPLHESHLKGATAEADAHCMKIIRDYVLAASEARDVGELTDGLSKFEELLDQYAATIAKNDVFNIETMKQTIRDAGTARDNAINFVRAILATRASEAAPLQRPDIPAPVEICNDQSGYCDCDHCQPDTSEAAPVAVGDAIPWMNRSVLDIAQEAGIVGASLAKLAHVLAPHDPELLGKLTIPLSVLWTNAVASRAVREPASSQPADDNCVATRHSWAVSSMKRDPEGSWVLASCAAPGAQQASEPSSECNPSDICAGCRCKYSTYGAPDAAKGAGLLDDLRLKIAAAPRRQFESAPGVYTSWLDQCAVLDILDAAKVVATLSDTELTLFNETADQFGDCNETSTGHATLMRWANMGLLECEHFTVTPAGEALLAGRGASKAEAQSS